MRTKVFLAIVALAVFASMAAAQTYQIRVTHNTNLRESYSLDSAVLTTARAGATVQVVGQHDRWLEISRDGRSYWMAAWVSHTRVEQAAPMQTQSDVNIDNCCFVDRQCKSDQEWQDGYWAYQNGQCAAPAQAQPGKSTQPAVNQSSQIDNCCFAGWHCVSNEDWVNGYHAYQAKQCDTPAQSQTGNTGNCCLAGWNCVDDRDWANGQWAYANNLCVHPTPANGHPNDRPSCCHHGWNCQFDFDWITGEMFFNLNDKRVSSCTFKSPVQDSFDGVIIEGPAETNARVKAALALLRSRSPEWYAYTITAPLKIRQWAWFPSHALQRSIILDAFIDTESLGYMAAAMVHESCHIQRWLHWVWRDHELERLAEEPVCDTVAINALRRIAPGTWFIRSRINKFLNEGHDFDINASANREWERAKLILSRRQ